MFTQFRSWGSLAAALLLLIASSAWAQSASAGSPLQVHVTNLTNRSFVVSWVTTANEVGKVKWGATATTMTNFAYDLRGNTKSSTLHYIIIATPDGSNLPNPTYFDVISATTTDSNGGKHYTATPSSVPPISAPDYAFGVVGTATGSPIAEALIYFSVVNANGAGSTRASEERSDLLTSSDSSFWHADLSALREASNLNNKFDYTDGDRLNIYIQTSKTQSAYASVDVASTKPVTTPLVLTDWTTTRQVTPTRTGTWPIVGSKPNAVGNSYLKGTKTGKSVATYTCTNCTLFRWYTLKGTTSGITQVAVDGVTTNIKNYQTGPQWQYVLSFFLPPGAHTIKLTAAVPSGIPASAVNTVLDALEVW